MGEKNPEAEAIRVVDRRRFTSAGDRRPDAEAPRTSEPDPGIGAGAAATKTTSPAGGARSQPGSAPPAAAAESEQTRAARQSYERHGGRPPRLNFETLIRSVAGTALLQLGLVEDPVHGPIPPDLEAARETIDLLSVLEEKTRGNLTPAERQLLEQVLYELRVSYVALTTGQKPGPPNTGR